MTSPYDTILYGEQNGRGTIGHIRCAIFWLEWMLVARAILYGQTCLTSCVSRAPSLKYYPTFWRQHDGTPMRRFVRILHEQRQSIVFRIFSCVRQRKQTKTTRRCQHLFDGYTTGPKKTNEIPSTLRRSVKIDYISPNFLLPSLFVKIHDTDFYPDYSANIYKYDGSDHFTSSRSSIRLYFINLCEIIPISNQ